jgi:hypothetical protein
LMGGSAVHRGNWLGRKDSKIKPVCSKGPCSFNERELSWVGAEFA